MPMLDVFNQDEFSVVSLTAAINEVPEGQHVPDLLDDLFEERGITTTSVTIERKGNKLSLVQAGERGSPGRTTVKDKQGSQTFGVIHLPVRGGVNADEIQGVRAFGSETETETVQNIVNQELMKMREEIDATVAYHRLGAVRGQVLDADGQTVLLDSFQRFGLTQKTQAMGLATATTKVREKITAAKRKAQKVIGNSAMITGWRAICGEGFFDKFTNHDSTEKAFERWNQGEYLRDDHRVEGFNFARVKWCEYYGSVGDTVFIDPDKAYLIPEGVRDMFITRFAPADYMETVNTLGLPYYAKQRLREFEKGVDLEAQTNVFNICTRPDAVIELTL